MAEWDKEERLVLSKLEEHTELHKRNAASLQRIEVEIEKLKIRSSTWGFIAGAIPAAITVIYQALKIFG